jgi:hypothetical protein
MLIHLMLLRPCLTKRLCSSALPQLAESLWTQFHKVLWAADGGDFDSTLRRAWYFDVICRVFDHDLLPRPKMWNLGVWWKIFSRARSSHNEHDSLTALRRVQPFRFNVISLRPASLLLVFLRPLSSHSVCPSDPAWLWQHQISWQDKSHSPEDFDWLVDYLGDVCSDDHETAGDIIVLLSSMRVRCSPVKRRLYIEKLIICMGSGMPPRLRHAALRAAHSFREVLASIDVVEDMDMVLTNFSPAILTAVCPQPGATPTDNGPDRPFHPDRDLCYLELIFALARNFSWRPHLYCQIDHAIRMIAVCCESHEPHAFYLVGIFLRMTSEQVSAASLTSITERQWWDMMRKAWYLAHRTIGNTHCIELLPVLVEGTKRHMSIASKYHLEQLVNNVDALIEKLGKQGLLEESEGVAVAVKELRGLAKDKLDSLN